MITHNSMIKQSKLFLISLALAFLILLSPVAAIAQREQPETPYYLVQEGDSLWGIAALFGVSVEELEQANGITDPGQLIIGMRLVIPGLNGIQGRIEPHTVQYGETLQSLSRRYRLPEETLARLNHLVSPAEVFAGATLIVPVENENTSLQRRAGLAPGQTLLELAALSGEDPWTLVLDNNLTGAWDALPGNVLQIRQPGSSVEEVAPGGLPEAIVQVTIDPFPLSQGKTTVIKVYGPAGILLKGSLAGRNLNFFPQEDGYVALQGVHTMTEPGLYPMTLEGKLPDGRRFAFSQLILIRSTEYIFDPMLNVDPLTVDPAVTEPENELWASLGLPVTPDKMWAGLFTSPVPLELTDCWTSLFGNRRAYNGSAYEYFHSGLDFCGTVGTELYAPAAGKVVYTGSLIVRGNVVVIDHGWGVYTAYDHLSEIFVSPGDVVQPGQRIGLGGATGRTTGPHLHWEVWVGGVQVDPENWLTRAFP